MKLADLLLDDWIAIPLRASDLREALQLLLARLPGARPEGAKRLARDLASEAAGAVVRINDEVVLVAGRAESLEGLSVILGIGAAPFAAGPGPARPRAWCSWC